MKKPYFLLLFLAIICIKANAQTSAFGDVDIADLQLTTCSFDKGANAMVLFSLGNIDYVDYSGLDMMVHKRLKIFNDKGRDLASIRLTYTNNEEITDIRAETINLVNNKIQIIVLDPKLIYSQKLDKQYRAYIFTLPGIKPGSVIDLKYTWHTKLDVNYPPWLFQDLVPTRFSQFEANFRNAYSFNITKKTTLPLVIDTIFRAAYGGPIKRVWALNNIPAFRIEPYMSSIEDNFQGIYFKPRTMGATWLNIGIGMYFEPEFGGQLTIPIAGEDSIVTQAKKIKSENEKIAYIFNTVKNSMVWNHVDRWFTEAGTKKAWENKSGNSTEINLILYRLLKLAGVHPSLLVLNTREYGEIEIDNPGVSRLNKTVVKVPIDDLNFYVLDASGKFNTYNVTPYSLLNLNMLTIDPDGKYPAIIRVNTEGYSQNRVMITGEIKSGGTVEGNAEIISTNYLRANTLDIHDKLGDKKYIDDLLREGNNAIEITGHAFKNMENDTLPLQETFKFKQELTGSDDQYIYFNPNMFGSFGQNPFISEQRFSDIDFIYAKILSINGSFIMPKGYKTEALPKPLTIVMPDNSITFKRSVAQADGAIIMRYIINFTGTRYLRTQYPELREFYIKMYEMLNEQIVLKKN